MAYESQIAGLGDAPAGTAASGRHPPLQGCSVRELLGAAPPSSPRCANWQPRAGSPLELVNGGGTGSLERHRRRARRQRAERRLRALRTDVVRRLPPLHATTRRALRAARRAPSRARAWSRPWAAAIPPPDPPMRPVLPRPYLPAGLRLDRQEGAGGGADAAARRPRRGARDRRTRAHAPRQGRGAVRALQQPVRVLEGERDSR